MPFLVILLTGLVSLLSVTVIATGITCCCLTSNYNPKKNIDSLNLNLDSNFPQKIKLTNDDISELFQDFKKMEERTHANFLKTRKQEPEIDYKNLSNTEINYLINLGN